jgi:hypothetical protein
VPAFSWIGKYREVLRLQIEWRNSGKFSIDHYARPSKARNTRAWPCRLRRVIPSTWPFRIIWAASIP